MVLIVLRGILTLLLFAVFLNLAQAERLWKPPEKYLPPEKLEPLLEVWDRAMANGEIRAEEAAVSSVTARHPSGSLSSRL